MQSERNAQRVDALRAREVALRAYLDAQNGYQTTYDGLEDTERQSRVALAGGSANYYRAQDETIRRISALAVAAGLGDDSDPIEELRNTEARIAVLTAPAGLTAALTEAANRKGPADQKRDAARAAMDKAMAAMNANANMTTNAAYASAFAAWIAADLDADDAARARRVAAAGGHGSYQRELEGLRAPRQAEALANARAAAAAGAAEWDADRAEGLPLVPAEVDAEADAEVNARSSSMSSSSTQAAE